MRRLGWTMAASAAVLLSGAAYAQDSGKVLTGKDAFGNWQDDSPGVTRHLTIDDLPPPGDTKSASNAPAPVPMPKGAMPKVPDGISIELLQDGVLPPKEPWASMPNTGSW